MKVKNMLKATGTGLSKMAGRTGLKLQKHSPEILLGVGIVGMGVSVVLACRSTLRAHEVLEKHEEEKEAIAKACEVDKEYAETKCGKDKVRLAVKTGLRFARLYAAPISVFGLSTASILVSHRILNKRYLGAVAAYNVVSGAFKEYRERVIEEGGTELDRHYMYGTEINKIDKVEVDENGKKHKSKEEVEQTETSGYINFDRLFDTRNNNFDNNPDFNMTFLLGQQSIFNDLLESRGHVFVNEIYDALGFPQTPEGSVTGWINDDEKCGQIDFGLEELTSEKRRCFYNGEENYILVKIDPDGVIWDKI